MPTYEYNCEKCGPFEYFQKITEDALAACPKCGGKTERLISASAFHLKGSGWYKSDYGGKSAPVSGSSESSGRSSESTASEAAKPAEAATPAPATSTTTGSAD